MNTRKPNIVYILADDMGYGDVRALNADCKFPTPNLDRIANEGLFFSDAHSSASVCTPSRYSILTGRYCWRTYLKEGVLGGAGLPLIEDIRPTVATLLKNAGYNTACIGKWHVGWEWAIKEGCKREHKSWAGDLSWVDYSKPIENGPTKRGFDYFFGISGSLDMPPYVYVENDHALEAPSRWATDEEFFRAGPRMKGFRANSVLGTLTDKAVGYINDQDGDDPFFLYFPLTAPHTPIAPAEEFVGSSGINDYADFCMEVDFRVGQVLDVLDEKGLAHDTLVIFSTDNGASAGPNDCAKLERDFGHYCSHIYRGYKSDIWDGGHRLPFLVRWPDTIKAGTKCDQAIGLFDLFATVADITGQVYPDSAGEDSVSFYPALKGEKIDESQREALIYHSYYGYFGIRKGKWKLCRCPAAGGWGINDITDDEAREQGLPELQLYDMEVDPGERANMVHEYPEIVQELTETLHRCIVRGRSVKGAAQFDDKISFKDWGQVVWLPEIPEEFVVHD